MEQCFIGNDVTLLDNVKLQPGCVIGPGVILGPDISVPRSTRFSNVSPLLNDPFRDESQPVPSKYLLDFNIYFYEKLF